VNSFPVEALPGPVATFVTEASRAIGCDPSYIALPLLSALAASIGNARRIELKRGWTEPCVLWTAIVGESGTHKSPALELALRPLRERQHRAMVDHRLAMRVHEQDHARWKVQRRAWESKGGVGDLPPEPVPPKCERLIVDDLTAEALVTRLQENPRGLLLVRDELSGWLGSFDRYNAAHGADAARWIEVHGARAVTVDRKAGGVEFVPRAAVSICGGIQPEALRRALGRQHIENGLAARLLFAMPPRHARRWTEAEVPEDAERRMFAVFARLLALEPSRDYDDDPEPVVVRLDAGAKAAWVAFVNEHGEAGLDRFGADASAWSKLESYGARLALVLHLVRGAGGEAVDPDRVDAASVEAGVELVRWFAREADRVYALLGGDDDERERGQLLDWIDRRGGAVSARDLTRGPRRFRDDPEGAEAALKELAKAGHGSWHIHPLGPGGGRPCWVFTRGGDGGDGDETPKTHGIRGVLSPSPVAAHDGTGDNRASPAGRRT
jgi:hypothetical protein